MKLQFVRQYWGAGDWKKFSSEVRSARSSDMLVALAGLKESILVGGCQRSGTTLLTRLIAQSPEIQSIWQSKDDELDAAYILAGLRQVDPSYRYCLQVTYLNQSYTQLLDYQGHYKLIWVVRNPHSVVYSMVHNWRRYPLNELFVACGLGHMSVKDERKYQQFGVNAVPVLRRACYAYLGKLDQLRMLGQTLNANQLLVVEYDKLIEKGPAEVENIFNFTGVSYRPEYANLVECSSTLKRNRLSAGATRTIGQLCDQAYRELSDAPYPAAEDRYDQD